MCVCGVGCLSRANACAFAAWDAWLIVLVALRFLNRLCFFRCVFCVASIAIAKGVDASVTNSTETWLPHLYVSITKYTIYRTSFPPQEGAMKGLNLSSVCEIEATIQGESTCSRTLQTVVQGSSLPQRLRRPITFINGSQMVHQNCLPYCLTANRTIAYSSPIPLYDTRVSPPICSFSAHCQVDLPTVSTQKKGNKTGRPISFDYDLADHHVYKRSSAWGSCKSGCAWCMHAV